MRHNNLTLRKLIVWLLEYFVTCYGSKDFAKERDKLFLGILQTGSGGCANFLQLLKANPHW